jgi:hypothetical protein
LHSNQAKYCPAENLSRHVDFPVRFRGVRIAKNRIVHRPIGVIQAFSEAFLTRPATAGVTANNDSGARYLIGVSRTSIITDNIHFLVGT